MLGRCAKKMKTKTLCILANSIKFSGRCIAGMEVELTDDGKWHLARNWIRPLSQREGGEINSLESRLNNNRQPAILDLVEIPLVAPAQIEGQPEDWFIERNSPWNYRGRFAPDVLGRLLEDPENLWLEFPHQSDRVSPAFLRKHRLPSLYLIQASDLRIAITEFVDDSGQTKKKRRARFCHEGVNYDLALTDPEMQRQYFPDFPRTDAGTIADGPDPDSILCVSLAPEFRGHHYKLVAGVIEKS